MNCTRNIIAPSVLAVVCLACLISVSARPSSVKADSEKIKKLEYELNIIRKNQSAVKGEILTANKKFSKIQHDEVYSNAVTRQMHIEITVLEEQLLKKRTELTKLIESSPLIKDLQDERRSLYKKQAEYRKEELLILNELKALRRNDMFGDFSLMRLMAGIVQIVVLLCLLISVWILMNPVKPDSSDSVLITLGFAGVLQIMALTFYMMQGRK